MRYVSEKESEDMFDDFIDDTAGTIEILGMKYAASRVLKEVDPIAYNCELTNFMDGEELTNDPDEADEEVDEQNSI